MLSILCGRRGRYVHVRKFKPIGTAFPQSGFTKEEVAKNLLYVEDELERWYASICFASKDNDKPSHVQPAVFKKALKWIDTYTTDENAYHIQRVLEKLLANVRPWALRIVRNHTEAMQLQCVISSSLIMLVENLLELGAFVDEEEDRYAAMDTANMRRRVMLRAKEMGHYRGKLDWTWEDIAREEEECLKLMRKLDNEERNIDVQQETARKVGLAKV